MNIKIPIKPLSVNKASRGRHFKTPAYQKFECDISLLLPYNPGQPPKGELFVQYVFYLKNYLMSDIDNCIKCMQDILVKRGYLPDDRYIKSIYAEKILVKDISEERTEIDVVLYADRYKILKEKR